MDDITRTQRSKTLSMWLRHKPERGGITLSKEGWASMTAILEAFERQEQLITRAELEHLIRLDVKSRFEMEGERVRARYGHSVVLEEKHHAGMPPATLYHGTAQRFLPKILEAGLKPMKRQYVHLSPDKKTAREVGLRRDRNPAIIVVAAHQANEAGIQFYPRGKGIWLSDPIPVEYLSLLEETPPAMVNSASSEGVRQAVSSPRRTAPGIPRRRRPKGGFMKRQET